jgi:hypothetical protein
VLGTWSFTNTGDTTLTAMSVRQVRNGAWDDATTQVREAPPWRHDLRRTRRSARNQAHIGTSQGELSPGASIGLSSMPSPRKALRLVAYFGAHLGCTRCIRAARVMLRASWRPGSVPLRRVAKPVDMIPARATTYGSTNLKQRLVAPSESISNQVSANPTFAAKWKSGWLNRGERPR